MNSTRKNASRNQTKASPSSTATPGSSTNLKQTKLPFAALPKKEKLPPLSTIPDEMRPPSRTSSLSDLSDLSDSDNTMEPTPTRKGPIPSSSTAPATSKATPTRNTRRVQKSAHTVSAHSAQLPPPAQLRLRQGVSTPRKPSLKRKAMTPAASEDEAPKEARGASRRAPARHPAPEANASGSRKNSSSPREPPTPSKRRRTSSPLSSLASSDVELDGLVVQTSQSDEIDMVMSVTPGRAHRRSLPSIKDLPPSDDVVDVDPMDCSPIHSPTGSPVIPNPSSSRQSSVFDDIPPTVFRPLTPPLSSDAEPEPVALDTKTKTDQLIADIRARVYASVQSDSEPDPVPFNIDDLESSSSSDSEEEAEYLASIRNVDKGKSKAPDAPLPASLKRYNLRRSPPATKHSALPTPPTAKPVRKVNPLDALLREKAREERQGRGMDALRDAEEAVAAAAAKREMQDEMDEDEDDDDDDDHDDETREKVHRDALQELDENVRQSARGSRRGSRSRSTSSHATSDADAEDEVAEEEDEERAARTKDAIIKMLSQDKEEDNLESLRAQEVVGIALWDESRTQDENAMQVEQTLPRLPDAAAQLPSLRLLYRAAEQNSVPKVSWHLRTDIVSVLDPAHLCIFVPWLMDCIFSESGRELTEIAFAELKRASSRLTRPHSSSIPSALSLAPIVKAVARLGASADVLEKHGWGAPAENLLAAASNLRWRNNMLLNLVSTIMAFAPTLPVDQLPDVTLLVTLIAMDPSAENDLRTAVRAACEALGDAMQVGQGENFYPNEARLCAKLAQLGREHPPTTQALLVSLFTGGNDSTARLGRCLARALLLPSPEPYSALPDLEPIVDLLTPATHSGGHFDIIGHAEEPAYYYHLTPRLTVLAKALSAVDEYVQVEKQERRAREQSGNHDRPVPPLERIRTALDKLHGRIVDTRAAHLDRSRAKAALQRLSFRVHYQRLGVLKSGPGTGKPRNLHAYFDAEKEHKAQDH